MRRRAPGRALRPPIVLLTDFGLKDSYVGVMQGVILGFNPQARIVSLTHEVQPQDVRAAAFHLMSSAPYFPKGSLFVAVVDPGVGSGRRVLWARAGDWQVLFPDNGVASWLERAHPLRELREVANRRLWLKPLSATFHGRDIFAPVAGRLSAGLSPGRLGPRARTCVRMPFPEAVRHGGAWRGQVLLVDRFGNAVTNLDAAALAPGTRLRLRGKPAGALLGHYAQAADGDALGVAGSSGLVELSVRNGDFAARFNVRSGDPVDAG